MKSNQPLDSIVLTITVLTVGNASIMLYTRLADHQAPFNIHTHRQLLIVCVCVRACVCLYLVALSAQ